MSPHPADEALARILEEGRDHTRHTLGASAHLWDALAAATEGGKRFRPALVLAAHDALGGTSATAAAQVGAAVEMLHTAFVVHDDVIDGDDVRRGRLNVSGTFSSRATAVGATPDDAAGVGRAAGILAGDLALAGALRAVALCDAPTEVVRRLLDLFDAALHATAAGELRDVWMTMQPGTASLAESLAMEEQKTSLYSFALPLQAGALLAGADEATASALGTAGLSLGAAFQLMDDLLGVFGDPGSTGKSTTSDLRSRKQTPLLVHALETVLADEIMRYVGRDLDVAELGEVRGLLVASGSHSFVEGLVESHLAEARATLDGLGVADAVLRAVAPCFPAQPRTQEAVA